MFTEPSGYARNFSEGLTPFSSFNPPNSPKSWELIISLPNLHRGTDQPGGESMRGFWTWQTWGQVQFSSSEAGDVSASLSSSLQEILAVPSPQGCKE